MCTIRKEIKDIVIAAVMDSRNDSYREFKCDDLDMLLTMSEAETVYFSDRITFGKGSLTHVDKFPINNQPDNKFITNGSGVIGVYRDADNVVKYKLADRMFSGGYKVSTLGLYLLALNG